MVDVSLDCPYCNTERVGFHGSLYMAFHRQPYTYILLLQCGKCGEGVVAKCQSDYFLQWIQSPLSYKPPSILAVHPPVPRVEFPAHLPDNIRNFFLQGSDSLRRSSFDAAGTMFRKSLDAALRKLHPEAKRTLTLQRRIDALPPDLGITPAMRQWAHEIRDLGNDAAHEEEPFTEPEAKALHAFTEMFLTYAFTLPGMLAERKAAEPPPPTAPVPTTRENPA